MKIWFTGFNTFGVKRFLIAMNSPELIIVDLWGFGLWICRKGGR